MQIIIPMSGFGERFRRAGYNIPKPLIEIEGKPIIEHVVNMFPGETNFIFICNQDHLREASYHMKEILARCCPTGKIIAIQPHKLGPVHAVLQIADLIDPASPAIVNYCDFSCYWDWQYFKKWVEGSQCDGAIPAYKGFHPHTLGTTNYAYMCEKDGWVVDIQEKKPYTDNRMNEYASSGTYYFASGKQMIAAFHSTIEQNLNVNGEYYVSLAYKPLLAMGAKIGVYPLQHFMQWGTPEDVAEYQYWSNAFRQVLQEASAHKPVGTVIVPMAGLGERFSREGYKETKPLISVSGKPMVLQATLDLPTAEHYCFVVRQDMPESARVTRILTETYPEAIFPAVDKVTEGQACTALLGLNAVEKRYGKSSSIEPVTFGACDNGAIYDKKKLQQLLSDETVDIIVWCVRGYPNASRYPHMFGWVDAVDDIVKRVSVKVPLKDVVCDPIILGTFTFKRATHFHECVHRMFQRDGRVNGEFYLDSCINDAIDMGLCCKIFEVGSYLSWGTPNDLRTFEYWQSCFHKWPSHPYSLQQDLNIDKDDVAVLEKKNSPMIPGILNFNG